MLNDFELKGTWYLPGRSRKRVSGVLRYQRKEGIYLDLIGTFHKMEDDFDAWKPDFEMIDTPIILGVSIDGKKITLRDCFEVNIKGSQSSTFRAQTILIGAHFKEERLIKFDRLTVDCLYVENWAAKSLFRHSNGEAGQKVDIERPDAIARAVIDGVEISVNIDVSIRPVALREMNLKQRVYFSVKFQETQQFEQCLNYAKLLTDFISLAALKPAYQTSLHGFRKRSGETQRVAIYGVPLTDFVVGERLYPHEMLFRLPDIQQSFDVVIGNWIRKAKKLRPVYNLYFGTLYSPFMYTEHRFLNYAQALETYHRRVHGGQYQTKEDYEAELYKTFVNAIPATVNKEYRESLKGRLKYNYEYSLRKRLRELVIYCIDCFPEHLVPDKDAQKRFVGDTTEMRNYLTHYGEEEAELDTDKLHNLTQWVRFLLELCFLREMGLEPQAIRELVTKTRKTRGLEAL